MLGCDDGGVGCTNGAGVGVGVWGISTGAGWNGTGWAGYGAGICTTGGGRGPACMGGCATYGAAVGWTLGGAGGCRRRGFGTL